MDASLSNASSPALIPPQFRCARIAKLAMARKQAGQSYWMWREGWEHLNTSCDWQMARISFASPRNRNSSPYWGEYCIDREHEHSFNLVWTKSRLGLVATPQTDRRDYGCLTKTRGQNSGFLGMNLCCSPTWISLQSVNLLAHKTSVLAVPACLRSAYGNREVAC